MDAVDANLKAGRTQVYDAALKEYCDARPHDPMVIYIGLTVRFTVRTACVPW
ncbi:MAG: hypothetical protein LBJ67_04460 [Planctomycetaceae bacterium]|nr:hypothetical protein [Planctomycetaceae bacterium]